MFNRLNHADGFLFQPLLFVRKEIVMCLPFESSTLAWLRLIIRWVRPGCTGRLESIAAITIYNPWTLAEPTPHPVA